MYVHAFTLFTLHFHVLTLIEMVFHVFTYSPIAGPVICMTSSCLVGGGEGAAMEVGVTHGLLGEII
jgi:hypothetical protein